VRLEDDLIVLRPFTEDDVPAITLACQDPEIPRWTSIPSPYTEEDARAFVRAAEGVFDFAVVDAATDQLLGSVGFGCEGHARAGFGYWEE
jgi:RimJ/RimL family protein N-acetyltransferase